VEAGTIASDGLPPGENAKRGTKRGGTGGMSPIFGGKQRHSTDTTTAADVAAESGWRFSLKGSPRHYDDVVEIVERRGDATVYFGEALTYERGAGVALWRIKAQGFSWLPDLYAWWADQERLEPVQFTFHLYIPPEQRYAALDLREHEAAAVERFVRERAPRQ
jgi:hypothetical protein